MCKDYVKWAGSSSEISGGEIKSKQAICAPLISLQFLVVKCKKIMKQHTDTIEKHPNENKFAMFDGLYTSSSFDSNIMWKDNLMK